MSSHFPTKKEVVRFYGIISQVVNCVDSNIWMGGLIIIALIFFTVLWGLGREGFPPNSHFFHKSVFSLYNLKLQSPEWHHLTDIWEVPAAELQAEPGNRVFGIAVDNYLHPLPSQVSAQVSCIIYWLCNRLTMYKATRTSSLLFFCCCFELEICKER